jgi:hypothetical protein
MWQKKNHLLTGLSIARPTPMRIVRSQIRVLFDILAKQLRIHKAQWRYRLNIDPLYRLKTN